MGFVDKWPSRNARAMVFSKLGRHKFTVGSTKSRFLFGGLPLPKSTSPEKFGRGGCLTLTVPYLVHTWYS